MVAMRVLEARAERRESSSLSSRTKIALRVRPGAPIICCKCATVFWLTDN